MSSIPIDRIAVNQKPFSSTGVDYFGPIIIKLNKRTRSAQPTAKRYGVLFTCLTTRGVHLEVATDMTTDAFILVLRGFIAWRGHVKILRSDNGSNFIGAEKELKHALTCIDQNKVAQTLSKQHIQWKFNPVKQALRTITRERSFTEDTLTTFLCEVESIVNQRPLTLNSDSIDDFKALIPYHFLLGLPSFNPSPGDFNDSQINLRTKWKAVQAATNMFGRRWTKEYLPTLVSQKKWTNKSRNLEVEDLVMLSVDHAPRSHWPLGWIVEVYPGKDDIVRSVKVKTPNRELIRPSRQLYILEVQQKWLEKVHFVWGGENVAL